jgi:hypothetical protein
MHRIRSFIGQLWIVYTNEDMMISAQMHFSWSVMTIIISVSYPFRYLGVAVGLTLIV